MSALWGEHQAGHVRPMALIVIAALTVAAFAAGRATARPSHARTCLLVKSGSYDPTGRVVTLDAHTTIVSREFNWCVRG